MPSTFNFHRLNAPELSPLQIQEGKAAMDREIAFISKLSYLHTFINHGEDAGGYIPISVAKKFHKSHLVTQQPSQDLRKNAESSLLTISPTFPQPVDNVLRISPNTIPEEGMRYNSSIIIVDMSRNLSFPLHKKYTFPDLKKNVYVHNREIRFFESQFSYCITEDGVISYDNLLQVCVVVEDTGETTKEILQRNAHHADEIIVLYIGDTEFSTTIKGASVTSYKENIKSRKDAKNILLNISRNSNCVFTVILDEHQHLDGNIRDFLFYARADDTVNSYSLLTEEFDALYRSNFIIKTGINCKFVHQARERLDMGTPLTVEIPKKYGYVYSEITSGYIQKLKERAPSDIEMLLDELVTVPDDSYLLYKIAEVYVLLEDWKNAYLYFERRVRTGNKSPLYEFQDAQYYMAVIAHNYLQWRWKDCMELYLNCYKDNPSRGDVLYFIAKHYLEEEENLKIGMMYLKQAFHADSPELSYTLRKDLHKEAIPKTLAQLCYQHQEFRLGEKACNTLQGNAQKEIRNWKDIYTLLNANEPYRTRVESKQSFSPHQKLICFVSPGGWNKWDGETLYTRGLGGSETFSIKYGEELAKKGYKVIVFCDCEADKEYNGVTYMYLGKLIEFISLYEIDVCILNRYCAYIPLITENRVKNFYFVLHDTAHQGEIIPVSNYLKNVMCISRWHVGQFCGFFPQLADRCVNISYGLDISQFPQEIEKEPYTFIYPSFPNRGLLVLLRLFPKIVAKFPEARLHTFCNTKNVWVQTEYKADMDEVERLYEQQKDYVFNHGWVNRKVLNEYWARSSIWFYPCTFKETCCLTSYEAAASKTLVISNHLAALAESIGDRGIIIDETNEENMLTAVFDALENPEKYNYLVERNYAWVRDERNFNTVVSDFESKYITPYV